MKTGDNKTIWLLAVVVSLILAANFFIGKEKERYRRISGEKQLLLVREANGLIEQELKKTIMAKEEISEELQFERKWSEALEVQLKEKEEQVRLALNQVEEKDGTINELLGKIESERNFRAKLERILKETRAQLILTKKTEPENAGDSESGESGLTEEQTLEEALATKPIELEKIVIKSTPLLNGRVLVVNKEHDFVVIDLGKEDNLRGGERFAIYRGDNFIARVRVEKVKEKLSAAAILPEFYREEIKEDDIARGL